MQLSCSSASGSPEAAIRGAAGAAITSGPGQDARPALPRGRRDASAPPAVGGGSQTPSPATCLQAVRSGRARAGPGAGEQDRNYSSGNLASEATAHHFWHILFIRSKSQAQPQPTGRTVEGCDQKLGILGPS